MVGFVKIFAMSCLVAMAKGMGGPPVMGTLSEGSVCGATSNGICAQNAGTGNGCPAVCEAQHGVGTTGNCMNVGEGTANQLCANPVQCFKCVPDTPPPSTCSSSGFDGNFCKGGSTHFNGGSTCDGSTLDCASKCCTWGACVPGGPPCDGSLYHCTCEPGPYTTRRNLRSGEPTEVLRVHVN